MSENKITYVFWTPRYSFTMEDDDMGRWARVAIAGNKNDSFVDDKVARWEIAWISKIKTNNGLKFSIAYNYPSHGKRFFDNLEEAQKEVEENFNWFINMCINKTKQQNE